MESSGGLKVISEAWRGTHGGGYFYVVEGDLLVHISKYAIRKERHDYIVSYLVPTERLLGKTIYYFRFSRKGYAFI